MCDITLQVIRRRALSLPLRCAESCGGSREGAWRSSHTEGQQKASLAKLALIFGPYDGRDSKGATTGVIPIAEATIPESVSTSRDSCFIFGRNYTPIGSVTVIAKFHPE
jgi:hypothetical protein